MQKQKAIRIFSFVLAGLIFFSITSCSKTDDVSTTTVKDIDGNVYNTVKIGTQTWMVENLKTTKYRNGDLISNVTDATTWSRLTTGAYCDYNNNLSTSTIYGKLYNWYAVSDSRNIAPTGWHVPTDAEWTILTDYLGGAAGGKLKEASTTSHWATPNTGATNETGFTALPSGKRYYNGTYYEIGETGYFWSSTEYKTNLAWYRYVIYFNSTVTRDDLNQLGDGYIHNFQYPQCGLSVRCIKD